MRTREVQVSGSAHPETPEEVRVLGVRIHRLRREAALAALLDSLGGDGARKVYIVNAHTLNLAWSSREYRDILNRGDLVLNDGSGVQLASRLAGRPFPDNLVGTDLVPQLCMAALPRKAGVFLLGGEGDVAQRAGEELKKRVPGLRVVGSRHGYDPREREGEVVDDINRSGARIVLVAMGNPLQEMWIHRNAPRLECALCIGVGGLFDHLSGRLRRAPRWMRKAGIEWVHILLGQPHKWRRYLVGNPLFVARLLIDRCRVSG